jgi:hypothetical protein
LLLDEEQLANVAGGWGNDEGGSCLADAVVAGGLVAGVATFAGGPELAPLGLVAGVGTYLSCESIGDNGLWW